MTIEQSPKCPRCNGNMKLRPGKYGKFWGCLAFPRCKGTRQPKKNGNNASQSLRPIKRALKSIEHPSIYQNAIFKTVQTMLETGNFEGAINLIINATAGSGKTASCEHIVGIIKQFNPALKMRYLVFNKPVATEAQQKGLPAATTHSEFFRAYREWAGGKIVVENFKVNNIVEDLLHDDYGSDIYDKKWMISPVCSIVSKVKNTLSAMDDASLFEITRKFKVDVNDSEEEIFDLVRRAMKQNNKMKFVIDFDDMLYMTYHHNVPVEKYDWVLLDEAQDLNRIQIELIKKLIKENGHAIFVGDRNQSVYGFRGAEVNSIDILQSTFDAKEMPLSITYRCPLSHIALINKEFPLIDFEGYEGSIKGELRRMKLDEALGQMNDGSIVMCRTNAPLVAPAFELIRAGRKAIILGRDIGQSLINLIEKFEKKSLDDTIFKLFEYETKQYARLIKRKKVGEAESLRDRILTIDVISEECNNVRELKSKITNIFSDDMEGVVFSSVHKMKGGESKDTYILTGDVGAPMPHPMAQTSDEMTQEENVRFVAMTRSKEKMTFIS